MKPMSPLSERPIASHLLHVMVAVCMLLVAAQTAEAQKPKLKLLEYNLPEDWHISCAPGPYYVEESVQRQPGELVNERIVYSHNRWSVRVKELSVSAVADEFNMLIGDTVSVESCEYLPDSSRAVLRRFLEANGPFKLIRAGASASPTEPSLEYYIAFDEPTQFGPVLDYVELMPEDRQTVIAITTKGGCTSTGTSVVCESVARGPRSQIVGGEIAIVEHGEFVVLDVSGRVIAQGRVDWGGQPQTITVNPGVYFVITRTSRQHVLVLP